MYLKIKVGTFECFVFRCRKKARNFVVVDGHWEGWRATTTRRYVREKQRFLGASRFVGEVVCDGKGCFRVL